MAVRHVKDGRGIVWYVDSDKQTAIHKNNLLIIIPRGRTKEYPYVAQVNMESMMLPNNGLCKTVTEARKIAFEWADRHPMPMRERLT